MMTAELINFVLGLPPSPPPIQIRKQTKQSQSISIMAGLPDGTFKHTSVTNLQKKL